MQKVAVGPFGYSLFSLNKLLANGWVVVSTSVI